MKHTRMTLKKDDLRILLERKKSEYPSYLRVEVTFPDIYQSELHERYGWSEAAVGQFDVHLYGKMGEKMGNMGVVVHQDDREFYTVDIPAAVEEPVQKTYTALEELLSQGPFPEERIQELKELSEQAAGKADHQLQLERANIREDTTLFWGYKKNPAAQFGHEGYCTVRMSRVKKLQGLRYDEEEFVGSDRKKMKKAGRVILDVAISGLPFKDVYGRTVRYLGDLYPSLFEEELLRLADSPDDVLKRKHRITSTTGDGERLTFLCSDSFARKVKEYVAQKFPYLEDTAVSHERK